MLLILSKGRKLHGKLEFQGLPISVENRAGSRRYWYDPNADEHGSTKMKYPYGYVRGTLGLDGDAVDVFVGPEDDSDKVFVVTQLKRPEFKDVDEQKVMLGFKSATEAKKAYLDHYNDPRFFGSMKELTMAEFKEKLDSKKGKLIKNLYLSDSSANIQLDKAVDMSDDISKRFRSKAQQKYMYAAAERGDIPKATVEEFSDKTKDFSKLPEHVKKGDDMSDEDINKAHVGFDKLKGKLEGKGHSAESAGKIAAAIGNKKYGEKKMHHAASEGKPLKEKQKLKKGCEHNETTACEKCDGTHSYKDIIKGLTSRMLSLTKHHRDKSEAVKEAQSQAPEFNTQEVELWGPHVARAQHVSRPFEPPSVPTVLVPTPFAAASPLAPDFMTSCNGCGHVHKSLDACPRCEAAKRAEYEAPPIWRR